MIVHLVLGMALIGTIDAPLADAAEARDWARVGRLIEAKAEVAKSQPDGMTALHWAVQHGSVETVNRLLEAKADPNASNRYGIRPIHLACTNGDGAVVRALLGAKADPIAPLEGNETPLMIASRSGSMDAVRALIGAGARLQETERKGQTAIMWAAAEGHAGVVRQLIDAGADFRASLKSGFSPMFFAVREGRIEVARVLLKAGVDVNGIIGGRKAGGKSPEPGTSPLVLAVENGHYDLAVVLLDAGADPNDQRSGFTPLHTLTWVRKPNRGDGDDGDPSPIGSGQLDSLGMARELLKHGAKVNARLERGSSGRAILGRKGATPFLLACQTCDLPYMRLLLESGADPKLPNAEGSTPLMAAAGLGCLAPGEEAGTEDEALAAVELLLSLGADIDTQDGRGETAMHGAAYKNLPKVVRLLTDRGARLSAWNRENKWGWTPLLIAEGHRPGNFKPSPETVAEIHRSFKLAGQEPPPPTPRVELASDPAYTTPPAKPKPPR